MATVSESDSRRKKGGGGRSRAARGGPRHDGSPKPVIAGLRRLIIEWRYVIVASRRAFIIGGKLLFPE